ncbi:sulfatase [Flagellimonas sp. 389]|uniref:sulfatase n=1 Tax=Flagellimonas sp. 389 TaxID=2835862 RepID=UPI002022F8B7|nr:sulfatase [Flagellimonas sp. 389]
MMTNRNMVSVSTIKSRFVKHCALLLPVVIIGCNPIQNATSKNKDNPPNILFIAVDDLRPELGCYGKPQILSPNIDKLAAQGFLFENAYCNIPVCGASRASILTGLRPNPNRFLAHNSYIDKDAPGVETLPELFKNNGYITLSMGKVLHNWEDDALQSWTEAPWNPKLLVSGSAGRKRLNYQRAENTNRRPPYERADVADSAYHDGKLTNKVIKKLGLLAEGEKPFFMAVGFVKPHLPFNAPAKYWDLYDSKALQFPEFMKYPENAPEESHHNSSELRTYDGIPSKGPITDEMARTLIHGYYACTSYIDAQIGLIVNELETLKLKENTIIVLWGDHGWSLGEHGLWCKHSTYNVAMKAPLIVYVPSKKGGHKVSGLVEFVDMYPSLVELSGLQKPSHLQGKSFTHLLDNPNRMGKDAVYGRWKNSDFMRTDGFSYTEWFSENGKSQARMLYNLDRDPNETSNLAELPEHQQYVKRLSMALKEIRKIE